MNKERRKKLDEAIRKLSDVVAEAKGIVEEARDEEQDAYDNLPQSLQDGDKGTRMQESIDELTNAADTLDTVETDLEGVVDGITAAQEA